MTALFYGVVTRRRFFRTSAAAVAASALPSVAPAQGARFRRFEISDPGMPPRMLDSYKKGIREMLNRPATDPRNWYRNAFLHVFDCRTRTGGSWPGTAPISDGGGRPT